MKIGIEVQRLFRKKKYGIETSSLELIKKIQQLDPKFEFVIFAKDDADRACFTASNRVKVKTLGGKIFADFEQIFLPLAAKRERIDLLHCTGNTAPYFSPVPVVQTLHDIIFMDPIPSKDSLYQQVGNLYRRKVVPIISHRSKVIITVSEYEKQRIVSRLGIDESRIEVIYNGINEQHFRICDSRRTMERVRADYKLPEDFILFLGNSSGRKNAQGAIEAYVMYASRVSHPLPLVTPGLSHHYITSTLRKLNAEYSPERFITPGYIRDEDLPAVYGLSRLFLFPSLSEGFGMPVIEAMACGTPVITSKISCMPEIAGDAALLVDPLSPPSIAEALITLLNNGELMAEKIQDGILNARRFSWTRTAEKVLGVYDKVLHPTSQAKLKRPSFRLNLEPNLYFSNRSRT